MGVVIMRCVWLECRGVVSGCCYHEVYIILIIIIDFLIVITYAYTPLVLALFCSSELLVNVLVLLLSSLCDILLY